MADTGDKRDGDRARVPKSPVGLCCDASQPHVPRLAQADVLQRQGSELADPSRGVVEQVHQHPELGLAGCESGPAESTSLSGIDVSANLAGVTTAL